MFDHPLKQYALFKDFEQKLEARETPGVPEAFGENQHAKAYWGAIRLALGETHFEGISAGALQALTDMAFKMDDVVKTAVAEHSLNPQNIEAATCQGQSLSDRT